MVEKNSDSGLKKAIKKKKVNLSTVEHATETKYSGKAIF